MLRVYKYHLPSEDCLINLPIGAQVLRANIQGDGVYIWALVNPDSPVEERRFVIFATGQDINIGKLRFMDVIFTNGFVFHVFEVE